MVDVVADQALNFTAVRAVKWQEAAKYQVAGVDAMSELAYGA
jgi:hypothetical protein